MRTILGILLAGSLTAGCDFGGLESDPEPIPPPQCLPQGAPCSGSGQCCPELECAGRHGPGRCDGREPCYCVQR